MYTYSKGKAQVPTNTSPLQPTFSKWGNLMLTILDLVSKDHNRKTLKITSVNPLSFEAIKQATAGHPGYSLTGISEYKATA